MLGWGWGVDVCLKALWLQKDPNSLQNTVPCDQKVGSVGKLIPVHRAAALIVSGTKNDVID